MCQKKNGLQNCNEANDASYASAWIVRFTKPRFDARRRRRCQNAAPACNLVSMPELPDIAAYISALKSRIVGQPLEHVRLNSAFLLRTAQPPLASAEGRTVGSCVA